MNAFSRPRVDSEKLVKILVHDGLAYFLVRIFSNLIFAIPDKLS